MTRALTLAVSAIALSAAILIAPAACAWRERPVGRYWELHMDGETLGRTYGVKGHCRLRAVELQRLHPAHTFDCIERERT